MSEPDWNDPTVPASLPYYCRALCAAIAIAIAQVRSSTTEVSNGLAEEISKAIYEFALKKHKIVEPTIAVPTDIEGKPIMPGHAGKVRLK